MNRCLNILFCFLLFGAPNALAQALVTLDVNGKRAPFQDIRYQAAQDFNAFLKECHLNSNYKKCLAKYMHPGILDYAETNFAILQSGQFQFSEAYLCDAETEKFEKIFKREGDLIHLCFLSNMKYRVQTARVYFKKHGSAYKIWELKI
jgi:hypothetical protein